MTEPDQRRDQLIRHIGEFGSCAVAFSGGVDSAVVAMAARVALGDQAVAVTSVSRSLAGGESEAACRIAQQIGIRHETIETDEFRDASYLRNDANRCFHCKTHLYEALEKVALRLKVAVIANGANADDLDDFRPGMKAATQHRVRSPLAECGLSKPEVRALARAWRLDVWDKPAAPCLASRVAYGEEVTPERLTRIDQSEQFLRSLGLREVRVRFHRGDMARLEVPVEAVARLAEKETREAIVARLKELGFQYVALDLEGFRSGSLNEVLHQIE